MNPVEVGGHHDALFPDPGVPPLCPARVADLLETLQVASDRLTAEVADLVAYRAPVSTGTIGRLIRLADDLRPGVAARVALATIQPQLLLDGTSIWLAGGRRSRLPSAAARAQLRWAGRPPS